MAREPIDEEMVDLFRTESAEQLDELEQALVQLETDPSDGTAVESARRQAHNLKGASRILGLEGIERIVHSVEDVLTDAEEDGLTQDQIDALYSALDAIQRLVDVATGGQGDDVPVSAVLSELEVAQASGAGRQTVADQAPAEPEAEPEGAMEATGKDPLERAREHRIETVRVDPHRLDVLMRRASELSATVQRLHNVSGDLQDSQDIAETLSQAVRSELPPETEPPLAQSLRRSTERLTDALRRTREQVETDTGELSRLADALESGIQEIRLLPMATTFRLFARAVRDLAREQGKRVEVRLEGENVRADKRVLEELKGPLMHLVRNAVDHGIETPEERREAGKEPVAHVRLAARRTPDSVLVEVEDDGRGIDPDEIRHLARERGLVNPEELASMGDGEVVDLVFDAGFTTRETVGEVSGRGIGLRTVAESAEELHGSVELASTLGEGTRVAIEVPVDVSTLHVVLARAEGHTFGIPIDAVSRVLSVDREDVDPSGGEATIEVQGTAVPVADIGDALGVGDPPADPFAEGSRPCIVLRERGWGAGVLVDQLVGEAELVVEPLGGVLRSVRTVTGASVLANGQVCIALDPVELGSKVREAGPLFRAREEEHPRRLLLVEDAEVTRRQLERTLEHAGWDVLTAGDGQEGIETLDAEPVDAVVTDIIMPNLDGVELTHRIRSSPRLRSLPVVLLSTKDEGEGGTEAAEAGADAFISKEVFDPAELADTLEELVA